MDELDNEQFAVGHYLQSLLKAPPAIIDKAPAKESGRKFKLLAFRIGTMRCAAEHQYLAGVQAIPKEIVPLPGAPSWLAGYSPESVQETRIIDLRALISGKAFTATQPRGAQSLIALQQGRLALLVDEVLGAETVYSHQVNWRGETSRRPWLAGVQKEGGLVILDVPGLQQMLSE